MKANESGSHLEWAPETVRPNVVECLGKGYSVLEKILEDRSESYWEWKPPRVGIGDDETECGGMLQAYSMGCRFVVLLILVPHID